MLSSSGFKKRKLETLALGLRGGGRYPGLLLAACSLGACSLIAPLDGIKVDSSMGGSAMAGNAQGPGAGSGAIAEGGAAGSSSVEQANGEICSSNSECKSTFCVEGVCCDERCGAACSSCREANTGKADGVCGFVQSGADPDADCDVSSDTCGLDGTCDGAGACRFKGVDQPCGDESCSGGKYSPPAHCDGTGKCAEPAPISCGNYPCQGTLCAIDCSPSVPCPSGLWCDSGSCKAKKPNGAMCNDAVECTGPACIEGVCCDGTCGGICRSCRAANTGSTEGHCAPITAGTDPAGECAADPVSSCQNDGYCDGASGCRKYANGTICRSKSCTDGANTSSESSEVKCSSGTCGSAPTSSCGDYKCGADACRQNCTQDSQCATGNYCESPRCVPTKDLGALCKEPAECTTGICGKYQTNVRFGHCCSTPSCNCPGPAFANLLQNPGFDRDLAQWDIRDNGVPGGSYAWYEFEERDLCSLSGQFERLANSSTSGYQVRLRQCVPVQQGTSYDFGGSWKSSRLPQYSADGQSLPNGEAWNAGCLFAFYATMALCQDYDHEAENRFDGYVNLEFSSQTTAAYQWFDFGETLTAPQAAQAAVMDCSGIDDYAPNTVIYFDKFYISPAPAKY